jgi:hypothetical protein
MKLTKKEKEILIKEIAERYKDVAYMDGESKARDVVNNLKESDFENTDNTLTVVFRIEMCIADILQIVGRHRRKEETK